MRDVLRARTRMSISERQSYVRWWIEESGMKTAELRRLAAAIWGDDGPWVDRYPRGRRRDRLS